MLIDFRKKTTLAVLTGMLPIAAVVIALSIWHRDRAAGAGDMEGGLAPGDEHSAFVDDKEILPGLYPPEIYGLKDWPALHRRVIGNLTTALLDLTRIAHLRGDDTRADVFSSLALAYDLHSRGDGSVDVAALPAGAATDREDLERRLMEEVGINRLYPSSYVYLSVHPAALESVYAGRSSPIHPQSVDSRLIDGIVSLLVARADEHDGDLERARSHAARSADLLCGVIQRKLDARNSSPDAYVISPRAVFLGFRIQKAVYPWGYFGRDSELAQILLFAEEAASLSGDARQRARCESLRPGVEGVREAASVGFLQSGPRTSGAALNRVPT